MTDPLIHPHTLLTTPSGEQVNIDSDMVPVITSLWQLGFTTMACCQNVGEATRAVRDQQDIPPGYTGDGFIVYHQDYALLKLPRNDARRLVDLLAQAPGFRDRVRKRWGAESWRMNVPLIHDGYTARLAPDALLHFPSKQIPELAQALAAAEANSPK